MAVRVSADLFGCPITATAQWLDAGLDVSLFGGERTHVGAVTLAGPEGEEQTMERPGHREAALSRPWALALANALEMPVCVRCGIHYDNATREQIGQILTLCDQLLARLLAQLRD